MKHPAIEITNEQIGQELGIWFNNEACEALARETGFIQRSTSRLTGSDLFNLLTVEALDEPTISYEGLCDILEDRNPIAQMTPQALCERMNSDGAVEFLKAGLKKTLKETTRPQLATMETAWLKPFSRVLLQDSTQIQIHEKMADAFKGSGGNASAAYVKVITATTSNMNRPNISLSAKVPIATRGLPRTWPSGFKRTIWSSGI